MTRSERRVLALGNDERRTRLREVAKPDREPLDANSLLPGTFEKNLDADANSAALLLRAGRGDQDAARAVYRAHVDRVFRHVARILGVHDPDLDDVVQRVFIAAFDGADKFDGRSKVSTWILGIATRRALDEARRRGRRERWSRVRERVGLGRAIERPDSRELARSEAKHALSRLTPDQWMVFVLHEVEGYTLAEIRELTNTGISTLHARLKAARKRLDRMEALECEDSGRGPEEDHDVAG